MSLDTWKEEFYPVEAEDCSREDALDHSIRKWEGLRKENLERHGVEFDWLGVVDEFNRLVIDSTSCALCKYYLGETPSRCKECPLAVVRGEVSCYNRRQGEEESPWECRHKNPELMIKWLKKAKEAGK